MGHFDGLEARPRRSLYTSMSVVVAVPAAAEESSQNCACDARRRRGAGAVACIASFPIDIGRKRMCQIAQRQRLEPDFAWTRQRSQKQTVGSKQYVTDSAHGRDVKVNSVFKHPNVARMDT